MIDHIFKCDSCPKEVRGAAHGGHDLPIGWTRASVTYAAKRTEPTEVTWGVPLGAMLDKYRDQLAQMPQLQTADCDLCDECGPKLAKFFETIGSPLRMRDQMGLIGG